MIWFDKGRVQRDVTAVGRWIRKERLQEECLRDAGPKNGKTNDVFFGIHFLHHLIIVRYSKRSFLLFEKNFKKISFGIVPYLYDRLSY